MVCESIRTRNQPILLFTAWKIRAQIFIRHRWWSSTVVFFSISLTRVNQLFYCICIYTEINITSHHIKSNHIVFMLILEITDLIIPIDFFFLLGNFITSKIFAGNDLTIFFYDMTRRDMTWHVLYLHLHEQLLLRHKSKMGKKINTMTNCIASWLWRQKLDRWIDSNWQMAHTHTRFVWHVLICSIKR